MAFQSPLLNVLLPFPLTSTATSFLITLNLILSKDLYPHPPAEHFLLDVPWNFKHTSHTERSSVLLYSNFPPPSFTISRLGLMGHWCYPVAIPRNLRVNLYFFPLNKSPTSSISLKPSLYFAWIITVNSHLANVPASGLVTCHSHSCQVEPLF